MNKIKDFLTSDCSLLILSGDDVKKNEKFLREYYQSSKKLFLRLNDFSCFDNSNAVVNSFQYTEWLTSEVFRVSSKISISSYLGIHDLLVTFYLKNAVPYCHKCKQIAVKTDLDKIFSKLEGKKGTIVLTLEVETKSSKSSNQEILELFGIEKAVINGKIHSRGDLKDQAIIDGIITSQSLPLTDEKITGIKKLINEQYEAGIDELNLYHFEEKQKTGEKVASISKKYKCSQCKKTFDAISAALLKKNPQNYVAFKSKVSFQDFLLMDVVAAYNVMTENKSAEKSKIIDQITKVLSYIIQLDLTTLSFSRTLDGLSSGEKVRLQLVNLAINNFSDSLIVFDDIFSIFTAQEQRIIQEFISKFDELGMKSLVLNYISQTDTREHLKQVMPAKINQSEIINIRGKSGIGKTKLLKEIVLKKDFKFKNYRLKIDLAKSAYIDLFTDFKKTPALLASYFKLIDDIAVELASLYESRVAGYGVKDFTITGNMVCPTCKGIGKINSFDDEANFVNCPECLGFRFQYPILSIKLNDKNIYDILELNVYEAGSFFSQNKKIIDILNVLNKCGLSELKLGSIINEQSATIEQRIKLANEILRLKLNAAKAAPTLVCCDYPFMNLYDHDFEVMFSFFKSLTKKGHSFVCVDNSERFKLVSDYAIVL